MHLIKKYFFFCLVLVSCVCARAQQLDGLLKQKPFKISGGIGVDQSLYLANSIQDRYIPYALILRGNVNVSIYGFDLPFSFNYTTQKLTYNTPQPFNIVGVSPSYKNLTLHAGFRNMTFSPYTLAGHNYLGGGAEYKFKKFKVMAMGGRLNKAVEYDSTQTRNLVGFNRYGGGAKISYSSDGDEISLISFYATDQSSSLSNVPDFLGIRPEENQVYSIGLKKKLNKVVSFNFEGALSGWNKDQSNEIEAEQKFYQNAYFIENNQATVFYTAYKTGVDLAFDKSKISAGFERVAPEYKTLGAYFMNSDFQNLTLGLNRRFFENKLITDIKGGLQRDDLANTNQTRMDRFVGSVNAVMTFSKRLKLNGMYSNFNSFINVRPVDRAFVENTIYDQVDTLNFRQVNQTASASLNWIPKENDNATHSINTSGNFSGSDNNNSGEVTSTKLFSSSISYSLNLKKSGVSISSSVNGNRNLFETGNSTFLGGGLNSSFGLFKKKLKVSLGGNVSRNYEGREQVGLLYAANNRYAMKIGKKQSVSLSLRYTGRRAQQSAEFTTVDDTFSEFTGNLNYSFRF